LHEHTVDGSMGRAAMHDPHLDPGMDLIERESSDPADRHENHHQKYYLRHDRTLIAELADYTPRELVESTVAARLNGYVAGRGTLAQLHDELPQFGLSAAAATYLERLVASRTR
jgi:selenoprotein methionine sulfoxide reductase A-like protein